MPENPIRKLRSRLEVGQAGKTSAAFRQYAVVYTLNELSDDEAFDVMERVVAETVLADPDWEATQDALYISLGTPPTNTSLLANLESTVRDERAVTKINVVPVLRTP